MSDKTISSLKRTVGLHKWIIENNFPKGFQILCHNCNYAKRNKKKQEQMPTSKVISLFMIKFYVLYG